MSRQGELLTVTEAAAVAGVTVRDVNRVIDERIVPEGSYSLAGGRWLKADACAFVRFYVAASTKLTADERILVIRALSSAEPKRWTYEDDFLTLRLEAFVEATHARHAKLIRARDMIVEDPEILGGAPVIRGTRIPVRDIAASAARGIGLDRLKVAYPGLDDVQIDLAMLYAQANPPRGRPRRDRETSPAPTRVAERKVVRRRRA